MTEHIAIRGAKLAVERRRSSGDSGQTVPLVWGHGLTSSRAHEDETKLLNWSRLDDLSRIVRYDARGHGDSSATARSADYAWSELARDQLALADELGFARYVAGGVSMGAATALHAAVQAPGRIAGLILAAPPTAWATRAAQGGVYEAGAALIESQGLDAFVDLAAKQPPAPIFAAHAELMAFRPQVAEDALPNVLRGAAASDLPALEALAALRMPALILAWATDPGHPVSTAEVLADQLYDTRLAIARELGELSTWPDRIRSFLEEIPA